MGKEMEKGKNIIFLENYYLKDFFLKEKNGMEKG